MKNERTYKIDDIEVKIFGNSKTGYFASFNYVGLDTTKDTWVMLHEANSAEKKFKTLKEIKSVADEMSVYN